MYPRDHYRTGPRDWPGNVGKRRMPGCGSRAYTDKKRQVLGNDAPAIEKCRSENGCSARQRLVPITLPVFQRIRRQSTGRLQFFKSDFPPVKWEVP